MPRKKILLVDDDPRLRDLVAATLGGDFLLLQASDGMQALEKARKEGPDLILLDVTMPHLDGFETCVRLKNDALTKSIPVVMLTALGSPQDLRRGREVGADEYFVKPFSPMALLDKVDQILG